MRSKHELEQQVGVNERYETVEIQKSIHRRLPDRRSRWKYWLAVSIVATGLAAGYVACREEPVSPEPTLAPGAHYSALQQEVYK